MGTAPDTTGAMLTAVPAWSGGQQSKLSLWWLNGPLLSEKRRQVLESVLKTLKKCWLKSYKLKGSIVKHQWDNIPTTCENKKDM